MNTQPQTITRSWPEANPFEGVFFQHRIGGRKQPVIKLSKFSEVIDTEFGLLWHMIQKLIDSKRLRLGVDIIDDPEEAQHEYLLSIPTALGILVLINSVQSWRLRAHLIDLNT